MLVRSEKEPRKRGEEQKGVELLLTLVYKLKT